MAAPGKKKSVDELWQELKGAGLRQPQRQPAARSAAVGFPGGFGAGAPPAAAAVAAARMQETATQAASGSAQQPQQQQQQPTAASGGGPPAARSEPAAAGEAGGEVLQQYVSGLQRTLNCLVDPDRATRRAAAAALATKLLRGDAATPPASEGMLQALLSGPLLPPLVRLLSDPLEGCRISALQLLLDAAPRLEDPAALLPRLLPALVARLGCMPVQEPSEEVRLAALQLLDAVFLRAAASSLAPAADDLGLLLARGLEDAFPDAKRAAAGALAALADRMPPGALEAQGERLLQALLPNLAHQHSKVRLAALSALQSLVLSGLPAGRVQGQLAPALKPLTFDRAVAVREAYYAALASWLGCQQQQQQQHCTEPAAAAAAATAHARCRTYAPALLPLLLLGVSDPQPEIAAGALAAAEQAGDVWQQQQPRAAAQDAGAPMEVDHTEQQQQQQQQLTAGGSSTDGELEVLPEALSAAQLPAPFRGLPGTACRRMVTALLPQLLPSVLCELQEWTNSLRSAAARLLHTLLVLAGPAAAPHLQAVLPAVAAAMSDEDPTVVGLLAASCRALGALVPCGAWLPLLVDALSDPKAGNGARANALAVASCLMHAAAAAGQRADPRLLAMLADALAADDVRCAKHAGVRAQLLAATANLLAWAPADVVSAAAQQLFLVLLQLQGGGGGGCSRVAAADAGEPTEPATVAAAAAATAPDSDAASAAAVIGLLAQRTGLAGPGQLAAAHAPQLLPLLTADAGTWTGGSANLAALVALLHTADRECLESLLPSVAGVLQPILADSERDASLRLELLRLLDALLEDPATGAAFSSPGNASLTLSALLMPPLHWRAGKSAAAVRFAAITALATLLGRRLAPPEVLLGAASPAGGLLPLLAGCLDEDWFPDVRLTACYAEQQLLQQVGSCLGDEARRAIYPELIKRLDDSSNKVRAAACAALVEFVRGAGRGYCATNSGYLAAGVALHMDDGDAAVAEAACRVLEELAANKPGVVAGEVRKVQERFRARHYCERVLAACERAASAGGGAGG